MAKTGSKNYALPTAALGVFAAVLLIAFLSYRAADVGQLPNLVGNLGGGPFFGGGIFDSLFGGIVALAIAGAWFGVGNFVFSFIKTEKSENHSHILELAMKMAIGAAIWSLIWFFLGLVGAYSTPVAAIALIIGLGFAGFGFRRVREAKSESRIPEKAGIFDKVILGLIAVPVVLSLIASVAPPTAKDTLLYHFAVPRAFIAQGGNAVIDGNIASYLSLGTEMHSVWAMLSQSKSAAGVTVWLFFPLLLTAVFGWAREAGISRRWSLLAVLMVATVPTAYHVASSGYIDIALTLLVTLAVYGLTRWWRERAAGWVVLTAIFLGAALAVKLTGVFVIAAFALVILIRARTNPVATTPGSDKPHGTEKAGKVVISGFAALLLAGVIASPWYIRTWVVTGSPVFPFYMSIWPGKANGWDVERSNLFQGMNSQYGGADVNKLNFVTAPVRVSVMAQPEQPANYDGVLGVAFLLGLPLLIWGAWKLELPIEAKIAVGVAGVMYLFWLFSSAQLRYLLPIVPALAIAIAASAESIGGRVKEIAQYAFAAASVAAIATSAAWFCQKAPLRVALGGETRDQYLTRNLDYYPYYQAINTDTPADAKVWLINMRRDTYNISRSVFSDYLFEDWTLRNMLWESRNAQELKAKAATLGVKYVLTRHDFVFDYDRSTLVDDKKPRAENDAKLKIAKEFILDSANTIKADNRFSLIKVF